MSSPTLEVLTKADRCDRCSAAASVSLQLAAGKLMFCGHHFAKYDKALRDLDAVIIGQSKEAD